MNTLPIETFITSVTTNAAATRRPEGMTFELTYGCNLRCVHCYNPTHRMLPHELTTAEVCSILDQIADLGVLTVTFTGGEPSLRPDILPILRRARDRGFLLQLLTNATHVTSSFAEILREVGVTELYVSIYGATEHIYERMTCVPGSYAQFIQGLQHLGKARLPVAVRMPVTTINYLEVAACRALVEGMGFKFQYCFDITPRSDGDLSPLAYRLSPEAKMVLDRTLHPPLPPILEESCWTSPNFISCACGHSRFAVTPYGEMNLCVAFPLPKYDLRTGTVKEGWDVLKQTVDQASPSHRYECPSCEARPHCRQGRSDAWLETGDMSSCLPHYKEWAQLEQRTYALLDPRQPR
jgi:radical SAM protein with 4Fe4S-binding SPASM domain